MSDDISIPHPGPLPARTSFTHSYRARRAGMDDGTRRLMLLAGALGLVLVAGMGSWSLMNRHHAGVPVIEADPRPLRVKPDNPGGMQVIGANEQIMGGAGGAETDAMAPAPETPDPQALRAQTMQRAAPAPADAPALPAAPPAPVPAAGPAVSPLPDTPAPRAAARAAPAATQPAGAMMVQLAAVDSEQAVKGEWQRLAKKMPDLLGHRDPVVQRAERDGKAVWRIRLGGFADTAEATGFCGRVRAKGGACSLATFQ